MFHDLHCLFMGKHEAKFCEQFFEFRQGKHTIMVRIETSKDIPYQWKLLTHRFTEFLEYRFKIKSTMLSIWIFKHSPGVVIHVNNEKFVIVHPDGVARK